MDSVYSLDPRWVGRMKVDSKQLQAVRDEGREGTAWVDRLIVVYNT